IHKTRPIPPYVDGNVRFTQSEGYVYAIVLADETDPAPPATVILRNIVPQETARVYLLGAGDSLSWRMTDEGAKIGLPQNLSRTHAWVLKFRPRKA
ncbi:hypothetical protein HQ520_09425, partial [bacterium]|nr:hypothetical protein [bacterium]